VLQGNSQFLRNNYVEVKSVRLSWPGRVDVLYLVLALNAIIHREIPQELRCLGTRLKGHSSAHLGYLKRTIYLSDGKNLFASRKHRYKDA
jgi:hypothetical protein